MAGFQTPKTIKEVINKIYEREYVLPAIQREFVWGTEQMISLFDSLMRGYPIGSFLFWIVEREKFVNFQFYNFIKDYHERDKRHNPKADVSGRSQVTAILDGQQRLTTLFLGLKGTYAKKADHKRWSNSSAFPKRRLYLNLLEKSKENDMEYDFAFLSPEKALIKKENIFWFEVPKIMEFEGLRDINRYLRGNELIDSQFADDCLATLFEVISNKQVINYYEEKSQDLEKVLNIFIRVNSGGTQLSHSDLLLSIATADWKNKDAREEVTNFVDEINAFGEGFSFTKDFVLKACLVLSDINDVGFKVDNFNKANMTLIESNWDKIKSSLRLAVELIEGFGYCERTLTATNAVIPLAYYILQKDCPSNFVLSQHFRNDRDVMKKWLAASLLRRAFSGTSDNMLRDLRKIIKTSNNTFPFENIVNNFRGTTKTIIFNEDDLDNLFCLKCGQGHIFSVFALLYSSLDFRNRFHQDHIFPKSLFKKETFDDMAISSEERQFCREHVNLLPNLQLLESLPNEEKSNMPFEAWVERTFPSEEGKREYRRRHYIPEGQYSLQNFRHFFNERKKMIKAKLKKELGECFIEGNDAEIVLGEPNNDLCKDNNIHVEKNNYSDEKPEYSQPRKENIKGKIWHSQENQRVNSQGSGKQLILGFLRKEKEAKTMDEIVLHMRSKGFESKTFYDWSNELARAGLLKETIKNGRKAYITVSC